MASRTLRSQPPTPVGTRRSGGARAVHLLRPSKQTCIALAALLGLVLLGGVGLWMWQKGEVDALQKQVEAKQEQVADGRRIAGRLLATEKAYADTREQLHFLETSVTASEYVPTLLRQMEGLAKSVNLQVGAVRPKLEPAPAPPADKEARKSFVPWPYDKIHVDMEVRGTYWDVAKLLYRLTEFPKILAVESVQVQPGTAAGARGVVPASPELTVNLKLTGFIFPNDGKGAGVPGGSAAAATGQAQGGNSLSVSVDSAKSAALDALPKPPTIAGKVRAHAKQF